MIRSAADCVLHAASIEESGMGELLFDLVGELVIELLLWPFERSEKDE